MILEAIRDYYADLFNDLDNTIDFDYLKDTEVPRLSEANKIMLDTPLSLAEVEIAIKQLAKAKCPGYDGIPIEFYNTFLPQVKHTLHSLFLNWIEKGEMSSSAREGIISLLDKPGEDQIKISNWRPLSLLCCDYKVYAKIIANRIQMVIDQLVHPDQSGFLKRRSIAQNLMDLNAVIIASEQQNLESIIVVIDFQKAYDTVRWESFYKVLEA